MKYNKALDYMALALASARNGDLVKAGKALVKASRSEDAKQAVAIIETSNAQAFAVEASAKAKTVAKAVKPVPVKAEFDLGEGVDDVLGDDEDISSDEDLADDAEVEASDEDLAEDGDEEVSEESNFEAEFASVLASMQSASKKPAKK